MNFNSQMKQSPKAVFFDLDETLIDNLMPISELFVHTYHTFCDQLENSVKSRFIDTFNQAAKTVWPSMFTTPTSPEMQLQHCFQSAIESTKLVGHNEATELAADMYQRFLKASSNNVRLKTDTVETLSTLSNLGYTTGIITNGIYELQIGKIHTLELQSKVDVIVVSAEARAHKPEQAVFDLALQKAKVNAESAWHIGDHATNDVAGAIRANMNGIFYDPLINPNRDNLETRINHAFVDLKERPKHSLRCLSDLIKLIN